MGLYRTIPVDVEAVQFAGMNNGEPVLNDMGSSIPSWLWRGITKGSVTFSDKGVAVHGEVMKDGDWVVFDGLFFSTMDEKKFHETFTKARKPINDMISAPKPMSAKPKATAKPLTTTMGEPGMTGVLPDDTIPDTIIPDAPKAYDGRSVILASPADDADEIIDKLMHQN